VRLKNDPSIKFTNNNMDKKRENTQIKEDKTEVAKNTMLNETMKPERAKKISKSKGKSFPVFAFVGVLILALMTLTVIILSSLDSKAQELKKLRNEALDAQASSRVEKEDLDIKSIQENVEKINSLFPNETGLVNFVREIEKMKEGGVVKGISFVSQDAVRDKNKYLGIPFVIDMEGSWESIDLALQGIEKLPYLVRTITVEARVSEGGGVNFKYGGFIYVDESLAKNR